MATKREIIINVDFQGLDEYTECLVRILTLKKEIDKEIKKLESLRITCKTTQSAK